MVYLFFFNDTATTEIYTLSLHDALPICSSGRGSGCARTARAGRGSSRRPPAGCPPPARRAGCTGHRTPRGASAASRSEEHTSELQSRQYLVCRLLLEKKKTNFDHSQDVE